MTHPSQARTQTSAERQAGKLTLPSDEDLLRRLAAGQPHAFDLLVARHEARVQSYLRHLVGDLQSAEDLTQEVMIRVLRHHAQRDEEHAFPVWLFRIARNTALNHLRARRLHRRGLDALRRGFAALGGGAPRAKVDARLEEQEFQERLERELHRLPEELRSAFLLRELERMSYEQIAAVVGAPPKTVSTRIYRARARLRQALADFLADGADGDAAEARR